MGGSNPAVQLSLGLSSCSARNCSSEHLITQHSLIPDKQHPSTQMTIFYGGMVNVYDDITPDKAQAIMMLASSGMHNSCVSRPPLTKSVPSMIYRQPTLKVLDLPLESKNSIQRFLQKRKDRQHAKAPHARQENPRPC